MSEPDLRKLMCRRSAQVAFRNYVALAIAAILLLAMNPPGSFLRSPPLAYVLGARVWRPVARLR